MKDKAGREIDYLRISITDRCNLRCKYCMPGDIETTDMENLLTYEEIVQVTEAAAALGILFFWDQLLWKEPGRKLAKLGTSLMLGGAVGNTYDRFKRGYVVDYLSLKTKNRKLSDITFNLSDLALFAGAVLTVWSSLFGKKR